MNLLCEMTSHIYDWVGKFLIYAFDELAWWIGQDQALYFRYKRFVAKKTIGLENICTHIYHMILV